jgi:hypothetical protein
LVFTSTEEGRSARHIGAIVDKLDGYSGEWQTVIKTNLERAVDFVMDFEERERAAFGPRQLDNADFDVWGEYLRDDDEPSVGPSSQRLTPRNNYSQCTGLGEHNDSFMVNENFGVKRRGGCRTAEPFKELDSNSHDASIVDGVETENLKDCVSIDHDLWVRTLLLLAS